VGGRFMKEKECNGFNKKERKIAMEGTAKARTHA
jgi:hypothetical protein